MARGLRRKLNVEIVSQIAHTASVTLVAFSPDGARVVSGGESLKLSDAATGASVAFSRDGARVQSGSWDNTIRLWDAATGALVRTFDGHSGWVKSVAFSTDGTCVLSGSITVRADRGRRDGSPDPHLRQYGLGQGGVLGRRQVRATLRHLMRLYSADRWSVP